MAEESEELAMIAEKARALLNRQERQVLRRCCAAYTNGQMDIQAFVDILLRLLPTPDKATFLVELRELVRQEDHLEYDHRVFALRRPLERPFRTVQFQSSNSLDFEESSDPRQCLLQVDRHQPAAPTIIMRETNHRWMRQLSREDHSPRNLKETKIPLMMPDMSSAFPTTPITMTTSTTSTTAKESRGGSHKKVPTISRSKIPRSTDDELIEVVIQKTNNLLGIAIEGGNDTRHHLPRIIGIDGKGTAFEAAGLRIGQTIVEVDGKKLEGLSHEKAARLIATSYADRSVPELKLILTASTFRHNANYQPEN